MHRPLLPRLAEPLVRRALDVFPVAVMTGARQTGKSTLVRGAAAPEHLYVTLDDIVVRQQAQRDPELLLDRAERMVIDEVQHAPDLLLAIKRRVDERREPGRYVLTGSADLLLHARVSESLAGRAGYVTLWPLTRREQLGMGVAGRWSELLTTPHESWPDLLADGLSSGESWRDLAQRGGYPVPAHQLGDEASRRAWFDAYAATYLERDVRDLAAIEHLADMRRLMAALCLRVGGLLNQADLARDVALSPTTVKRYVNLLEVSYQVVRLPAYAVNRTKRLVKAPKIYWSDTGLAMTLSGETEPRGEHLENLVLTDLLAWTNAADSRPNILHWRTSSGAEVDFVIELPQRLLPIEVKAARRVTMRDARHLVTFIDEYADRAAAALLLYDGEETFWLDRRVLAVPWWAVV